MRLWARNGFLGWVLEKNKTVTASGSSLAQANTSGIYSSMTSVTPIIYYAEEDISCEVLEIIYPIKGSSYYEANRSPMKSDHSIDQLLVLAPR